MDPTAIDRSLESLSQAKDRWARLPIRERIGYLERVRDLLVENADAWVAAGVQLLIAAARALVLPVDEGGAALDAHGRIAAREADRHVEVLRADQRRVVPAALLVATPAREQRGTAEEVVLQ